MYATPELLTKVKAAISDLQLPDPRGAGLGILINHNGQTSSGAVTRAAVRSGQTLIHTYQVSNSGPETRRLRTSHASSWTLTIGRTILTRMKDDLDDGWYSRDGQLATHIGNDRQ